MKRLTIFTILIFLIPLIGYPQSSEVEKLNLDFEQILEGHPENWEVFGSSDYRTYIDSTSRNSGKFSAVIESSEGPSNFKALAITLPNNYKGKSIRLSGYIKTENVTEGHAGLWMRIDPQIAFDNMGARGITGTTDWQEYEITLPLSPEKTDQIIIGGLLVGKGKMWLDNMQVSIDGKELDSKDLEIYTRELLPADKDTAFDNGTTVRFPELDRELISSLELLGKIWGFMKYHHPEIAKGNYNWDYELFRFLPEYVGAGNKQERDEMLITWIEKFGALPECENCEATSNEAILKPDTSWIDDSELSSSLTSKLKDIYNNRHQGEHYYISLQPSVGNPVFSNESSYSNMPYPDSGFRLLSLYKYWNMIEYFFPNKHLTNENWSTVLRRYIPEFLNAENELEYELAAVKLIGEINDTHANLWGGNDKISESRGNNFAAFRGEFVENKFIVTDFYNPELIDTTKIKIGDEITHINGKPIEAMVDSLRPYYPSSNDASMLRDISIDLLRSSDSTINLTYHSGNRTLQREIILYDREDLNMYHWYRVDENEQSFRILDGNIGYINLANIKEEDIPKIKKSLKDTKGIIIDIRNYPSAFVPFSLGSYFVTEPTDFVKFSYGNPANPGEFTFREGPQIKSDQNNYEGKLVVLVNEKSQSQAEYTAMAFRAVENSTIVGSTTAGADGNVSTIFLPGGLRTMISGIGIYYPDGTETQRVGIVPDIIVKPSVEGIKKGKDEVLEEAIQLLNQ